MFVKYNISIATDDDIIHLGDDVNMYPVYLSRPFIIWGNGHNLLEKTIVPDHIFVNFLLADFGTHLWPVSVYAFKCEVIHIIVARAVAN